MWWPHVSYRSFKKGTRRLGTAKSTGTIKAKKLLIRLGKENGTKNLKNTQENVECDSVDRWDKESGSEGR